MSSGCAQERNSKVRFSLLVSIVAAPTCDLTNRECGFVSLHPLHQLLSLDFSIVDILTGVVPYLSVS